MKNSTADSNEQERLLETLEAEADKLLIEIESESDIDKNILLTRDYNNLSARIEAKENLLNKDNKIKKGVSYITKVQTRQSKRCGSV